MGTGWQDNREGPSDEELAIIERARRLGFSADRVAVALGVRADRLTGSSTSSPEALPPPASPRSAEDR